MRRNLLKLFLHDSLRFEISSFSVPLPFFVSFCNDTKKYIHFFVEKKIFINFFISDLVSSLVSRVRILNENFNKIEKDFSANFESWQQVRIFGITIDCQQHKIVFESLLLFIWLIKPSNLKLLNIYFVIEKFFLQFFCCC